MSEQPKMPGLGRLHVVDMRDLDHLLPRQAAVPTAEPTVRHYRHWRTPKPLNQNITKKRSSCCGHGGHHLLLCSPIRNIKNIPGPLEIYDQAQLIDEWSGVDPEIEGTSVRATVKVLQRHGYISSYKWAFDAATGVNHLLNVSPMLIGVDWFDGMFRADKHGYIHPTGELAGGHCVVWSGVNVKAKNPDGSVGYCVILNSWGPEWANKGKAKISIQDMDRLIRSQGEACAVQEVLKPVPVV